DLISKTGIYSESDLTSYLSTIFGSSNPFAVFTQSNPGQAASNCPYGFANVTGRTTQSYSTGDALVEFPNNFKVISFAQQVGSSPSSTACGSFEALRTQANCQPQPLSGLP